MLLGKHTHKFSQKQIGCFELLRLQNKSIFWIVEGCYISSGRDNSTSVVKTNAGKFPQIRKVFRLHLFNTSLLAYAETSSSTENHVFSCMIGGTEKVSWSSVTGFPRKWVIWSCWFNCKCTTLFCTSTAAPVLACWHLSCRRLNWSLRTGDNVEDSSTCLRLPSKQQRGQW